jgi:hypothetical protein
LFPGVDFCAVLGFASGALGAAGAVMATEPPQNQSFRRLYARPDSPLPDGPRFRRRLATIVQEYQFDSFESRGNVGRFMESQFGIEVPHYEGMGGRVFRFEEHFLQSHIHDVLESITAIARFLAGGTSRSSASDHWVRTVRRILAEEHMAYRIDDDGVVHPLVDQAFEAARVSVIGALAGEAFNAARTHFEDALAALEEEQPDTRGAVRNCFDAAENLFKLLTGTGQDLTQANVTATLKPIVDRLHGGLDPATQSHAGRMLSSFADWANAGHPYRHAQAGTEIQEPTHSLAVLYLSTGAGFIRWLAHMLTMARL